MDGLPNLLYPRESHIAYINAWISNHLYFFEKPQLLEKDIDCTNIGDESFEKLYNLYCHDVEIEPVTEFEINMYGEYFMRIDRFFRAIQYFEKNNSYGKVALCYKKMGDEENMVEWYEKGCNEGSVDCMRALANYHNGCGKSDEAITYYKRAYYNGHSESTIDIANCYFLKEQINSAKIWWKTGAKAGLVPCMISLAEYYRRNTWKYGKMKAWYEKAIEKNSTTAMKKLAEYYANDGEIEMMEIYYRMAIDAGDIQTIDTLINFFKRKNNYAKVEEYYIMKINSAPDRNKPRFIKDLINILNRAGEYMKTIPHYEKLIESGNHDEIYNLADIYKKLHQTDKELECYQKAMDDGIIGAYKKMGMYYVNMRTPNYPEAIKYYLQACERKEYGARSHLNDALQNYPDIDLITRSMKYLNKKTYHKLNMMIVNFIELHKNGLQDRLEKDECCICLEEDEYMVHTMCPCNSGVCASCYKQIIECPFCQDPIQ